LPRRRRRGDPRADRPGRRAGGRPGPRRAGQAHRRRRGREPPGPAYRAAHPRRLRPRRRVLRPQDRRRPAPSGHRRVRPRAHRHGRCRVHRAGPQVPHGAVPVDRRRHRAGVAQRGGRADPRPAPRLSRATTFPSRPRVRTFHVDFTRNETQAAVAEAVAGALTTAAPAEDLLTALPSRSVDEAGYDERLWAAFAGSGLLSLGLPVSLVGDGVSVADIGVVLEEVGRAGVVIPALETLGFGVWPIVALGTPEQQKRLLSGIEDGRILTAAVAEPGAPLPPEPTVRLEGGTLTGTVTAVRYAAQARSVVVPVSTSEGAALVVVAPDAPGVTLTPTLGSLGVPEYAVRFGATPVDDDDVLRGSGEESAVEVFRRLV